MMKNSFNELQKHINDLKNQSAQGQDEQLVRAADQRTAKAQSFNESNPGMVWFGQLASQVISTGINTAITGAIPSSVSMFTFKLPHR